MNGDSALIDGWRAWGVPCREIHHHRAPAGNRGVAVVFGSAVAGLLLAGVLARVGDDPEPRFVPGEPAAVETIEDRNDTMMSD